MRITTLNHYIGVDLGHQVNHSAFAVAAADNGELRFIHLERVPLQTGYLCVLRKLRNLVRRIALRGPSVITVVVDAAGPGQIALELVRKWKPSPIVVPVSITRGRRPGVTKSGNRTVPRYSLIANLADWLTKNKIHVTRATRCADVWIKEIQSIQTDGGQNEHDDLAIATALTVWYAGSPENRNAAKNVNNS